MSSNNTFKTIGIALFVSIFVLGAGFAMAQDSECIKCHTSEDELNSAVGKLPAKPKVPGSMGPMLVTPLDRVQKVLVKEAFLDDENHGGMGCEECHGGDPGASDFEAAHKDIVRDPTFPAPEVCADCHDQGESIENSFHYSMKGMKHPIGIRAGGEAEVKQIMEGFNTHCGQCHSSCGQCHISRPQVAGGGLAAGHLFQKTPLMKDNCLSCHQGVATEWLGDGRALKPDVHHAVLDMQCSECHSADEMHGVDVEGDTRYEAKGTPKCLDCHGVIFTDKSKYKKVHAMHKDKVSCYVCHAQPYNQCAGCHVKTDGSFKLDKYWTEFKIGRNPRITEDRPERFVTVGRIPVEPDTFRSYTKKDMKNFHKLPNWNMATPHNIQRKTPQNRECNNCHGNWDLFLLLRDVDKDELLANRPVIVPPGKVPAKIKDSE